MKRTPMPARKTWMKAAQPAPRTARPARARSPRTRKTARATGPSADTRLTVQHRDGGLCVRCKRPASDQHHRKGRGMGGTKGAESDRINGAAWLLTLCGMGNAAQGCHKWVDDDRDRSVPMGYVIPRNGVDVDAEDVPVLTLHGWVKFDNDGGITPCAPPAGYVSEPAPLRA